MYKVFEKIAHIILNIIQQRPRESVMPAVENWFFVMMISRRLFRKDLAFIMSRLSRWLTSIVPRECWGQWMVPSPWRRYLIRLQRFWKLRVWKCRQAAAGAWRIKMAVSIKSDREIGLMREAGKILAEVHARLGEQIRAGISTLEIDRIGEELIRGYGWTITDIPLQSACPSMMRWFMVFPTGSIFSGREILSAWIQGLFTKAIIRMRPGLMLWGL